MDRARRDIGGSKDELVDVLVGEMAAMMEELRTDWLPCWRNGELEDALASELAGVLKDWRTGRRNGDRTGYRAEGLGD